MVVFEPFAGAAVDALALVASPDLVSYSFRDGLPLAACCAGGGLFICELLSVSPSGFRGFAGGIGRMRSIPRSRPR